MLYELRKANLRDNGVSCEVDEGDVLKRQQNRLQCFDFLDVAGFQVKNLDVLKSCDCIYVFKTTVLGIDFMELRGKL